MADDWEEIMRGGRYGILTTGRLPRKDFAAGSDQGSTVEAGSGVRDQGHPNSRDNPRPQIPDP